MGCDPVGGSHAGGASAPGIRGDQHTLRQTPRATCSLACGLFCRPPPRPPCCLIFRWAGSQHPRTLISGLTSPNSPCLCPSSAALLTLPSQWTCMVAGPRQPPFMFLQASWSASSPRPAPRALGLCVQCPSTTTCVHRLVPRSWRFRTATQLWFLAAPWV